MCEKSLLQEIEEVNIAMGLINLGARMQVLESETSLSRRRLLRLYKELRGCPPPKGMFLFLKTGSCHGSRIFTLPCSITFTFIFRKLGAGVLLKY